MEGEKRGSQTPIVAARDPGQSPSRTPQVGYEVLSPWTPSAHLDLSLAHAPKSYPVSYPPQVGYEVLGKGVRPHDRRCDVFRRPPPTPSALRRRPARRRSARRPESAHGETLNPKPAAGLDGEACPRRKRGLSLWDDLRHDVLRTHSSMVDVRPGLKYSPSLGFASEGAPQWELAAGERPALKRSHTPTPSRRRRRRRVVCSYAILVWELFHTTVPYSDWPDLDQVLSLLL